MMQVESGCYYSVSETGQTIWRAIDGKTRVSSIVDLLMSTYDIDRAACEVETLLFLEDLASQKLITRVQ